MSPTSYILKASSTCCSLKDLLILNSKNLGALRTQAHEVPLMRPQGKFRNTKNWHSILVLHYGIYFVTILTSFKKNLLKIINTLKNLVFVPVSHPMCKSSV